MRAVSARHDGGTTVDVWDPGPPTWSESCSLAEQQYGQSTPSGPGTAPVSARQSCDANHGSRRGGARTNEVSLAKEKVQRRTLGFAQRGQAAFLAARRDA